MKRPTIKSPCVADRYHLDKERIAEVSFPDGSGCLIRLSTRRGVPEIVIYRCDTRIEIGVPAENVTVKS